MIRWISARSIVAPPATVFRAVADPEEFQKAIPDGSGVEYLTAQRSGVGTRFRTTRLNRGKPMAFEQEVTDLVPGERVRMLNVTHGTPWDSTFTIARDGGRSVLTLTMDARPVALVQKIMMRLLRRTIQKALERDMDAVKAHCERDARTAQT